MATLAEQSYSFFIPTVSVLGVGCAKGAGKKAKELGFKKALIVTDAGLTKMGIAAMIAGNVREAGVEAVIYDGAEPNPTDVNVRTGVKVWKENHCDSLITLGGGSAHDCGKGIGLMIANGGDIRDFEGVDKSSKPFVPYIAINTTAGTASEMTRFCIITNTSTHVKMAIVDWRMTAQCCYNDPVLMLGKPPALTAATGMDALTHAIEAYVSTLANPITDACALMAIKLIAKWLRPAVALGTNIEARDQMAYAQFLAGMAFNNASLGYVHSMAHQLGGLYNLPHGVCNAILLPVVEKFNIVGCPEKFRDIAEAMGVCTAHMTTRQAADAAIDAIKQLSSDIGIPKGLRELKVKEADFPLMAENAKKDACQLTNPRLATLEDVVQMFKDAM